MWHFGKSWHLDLRVYRAAGRALLSHGAPFDPFSPPTTCRSLTHLSLSPAGDRFVDRRRGHPCARTGSEQHGLRADQSAPRWLVVAGLDQSRPRFRGVAIGLAAGARTGAWRPFCDLAFSSEAAGGPRRTEQRPPSCPLGALLTPRVLRRVAALRLCWCWKYSCTSC